MDPEKKSLNFIFPTKYVIPKSLKFSHWPSKPSIYLLLILDSRTHLAPFIASQLIASVCQSMAHRGYKGTKEKWWIMKDSRNKTRGLNPPTHRFTPLKTNMSPRKGPFQKERILFQPLILRAHVNHEKPLLLSIMLAI